jgi:hypothetical protein
LRECAPHLALVAAPLTVKTVGRRVRSAGGLEQTDRLQVCRRLNAANARYLVIGGMAIIHHGLVRATEDVGLLIDPSPENLARIQEALDYLPDHAIRNVRPTDVEHYTVVRVADEICLDREFLAEKLRHRQL